MNFSYAKYGKEFNRRFLSLPAALYPHDKLMQNFSAEKALLENRHVLSGDFEFIPILVLNGKTPSARGAVTIYPGDDTAYFGFFESVRCPKAARMVFERAERIARSHGCKKISGPVDASFWIRYRLKTNHFEQPPYAGEPYNLPYYEKFFRSAGYSACHEYKSMRFGKITDSVNNRKFAERLENKLAEGYKIISPEAKNFDRTLREIYSLLIKLYSDFPGYKYISEEQFVSIYGSLKFIVDYSMVKMAYKNGRACGFYVSIPNIGNLTAGRPDPLKLMKLLKIKKHCDDYVMLYMGVDNDHHGLGKALVQSIRNELAANGARSVGALIHTGKITGGYYADNSGFDFKYRLYEKIL
ncbi:MAG: hypothetical protein ACI4I9_05950 [Porcipelethomonas sp.]